MTKKTPKTEPQQQKPRQIVEHGQARYLAVTTVIPREWKYVFIRQLTKIEGKVTIEVENMLEA